MYLLRLNQKKWKDPEGINSHTLNFIGKNILARKNNENITITYTHFHNQHFPHVCFTTEPDTPPREATFNQNILLP